MIRKTFALTNRALRVDARSIVPHAMRLGFAFFVFLQFFWISLSLTSQAPGREVFRKIVWTNAMFASIVVPLIFANAITEEKEERTLALLKIANVSGLTIIAGKSIPRMVILLLILFVQLPFSMLAITLGGVTVTQVLACYLAIGAYALFAGCLALWCSVIYHSTANAVGLAGLLIFGYHVIPNMLSLTFSALVKHPNWGRLAGVGQDLLDYHWATNIFSRLPQIMAVGSTEGLFSWQVASNLIAGVVFFLLSWASFEFFNREIDAAPVKRGRRRKRRQNKDSESRRTWKYALAWKDFYFLAGGMKVQVIKFILYGLILLLIAGMQSDWQLRRLELPSVMTIFTTILSVVILPIELALLISRVFHKEVKEKTISSLIMLPTPLWKIAYAKLGGLVLSLIPGLFWLAFALCFIPDAIGEGITAFFESSPLSLLIALNVIAHVLLYLHLVVYLSLSMSSWWALFVAYFVHYFGCSIPFYMLMAAVMILNFNVTEEMGMLFAFGAAVVVFVFVGAFQYLIGETLKKKAAAD